MNGDLVFYTNPMSRGWLFFAAGPLEAATTNRFLGFEPPADKEGMVGYGRLAAHGAVAVPSVTRPTFPPKRIRETSSAKTRPCARALGQVRLRKSRSRPLQSR